MALAAATQLGELRVLSKCVSSITGNLVVSFLLHFVARTECADSPLPWSVRVRSLRDFTGDLEEGSLLCLVHTLRAFFDQSMSVVAQSLTLFISPRSASCAISKNAIS